MLFDSCFWYLRIFILGKSWGTWTYQLHSKVLEFRRMQGPQSWTDSESVSKQTEDYQDKKKTLWISPWRARVIMVRRRKPPPIPAKELLNAKCKIPLSLFPSFSPPSHSSVSWGWVVGSPHPRRDYRDQLRDPEVEVTFLSHRPAFHQNQDQRKDTFSNCFT